MDRLGILGQEIDALKAKRATNSLEAARAEETATMARDKANEAKQVSKIVISYKGVTSIFVRNWLQSTVVQMFKSLNDILQRSYYGWLLLGKLHMTYELYSTRMMQQQH